MDEQKQYKIEVLPAALSDIDYIVDYLNTLSARIAEKSHGQNQRWYQKPTHVSAPLPAG